MLLRCPINNWLLPTLRSARDRWTNNARSIRSRVSSQKLEANNELSNQTKPFEAIAGPRAWPIFGNVWDFRKLNMMHKTMANYSLKYGPGLVRFYIGSTPWVLVADLTIMHDLVTTQSKTFEHRGAIDTLDFVYSAFFGAPATESGVFFANGQVWKRNRHALMMILNSPTFRKRTMDIFDVNADHLVSQWKQSGVRNVELMEEMIKFSTDAIGELCYSTNLGAIKGKFVESFIGDVRFLLNFVNTFLYAPMLALKAMKLLAPVLPFMSRFKSAVDNLRIRGEKMLQERQEERSKGLVKNDLLDHLLEYSSSSDEKRQITSADVNSILFDVVGAGHDSVSNLFATTLAQLAANPNYQERLHHEIRSYIASRDSSKGQTLDENDLRELPFLDCVIREALRIYPSGAITVRSSNEDTVVGGYHIPAKTQLVLLPYGVQRHPDHWDAPDEFKPERWATNKHRVNNLSYIPFGGGSRSCLGGRFATNEAKVIVAKIILNFKIEPLFDPQEDLDSQVQFTLRPASPLRIRVIPRSL